MNEAQKKERGAQRNVICSAETKIKNESGAQRNVFRWVEKKKIGVGKVECESNAVRFRVEKKKVTNFETMKDCAEFFGFKKGWFQNRIRKHGCKFSYNG